MKTTSLRRRLIAALMPLVLAACGGGNDGPAPLTCSVPDQQAWLSSYFDDWYFWYRISPRPPAGGYATVDGYFKALLYTGTDTLHFPDPDRWSFYQSTESFNRFFGDGASLGYGVSVAGNEVIGNPSAPLYVRYVEPASPAAGKVFRGDQIISINGRAASTYIAANDFSVLGANNPGDRISMVVRDGTGDYTVDLTASVFTLTPVSTSAVVTSPLGRKMGYVVVKDMISQVNSSPNFALDGVFAGFKAVGVNDIVLDLRYNGGGLVSVGAQVASYVAGARGSGHVYASLLYNDKRSDNNRSFGFDSSLASAAGVPRVFVLTGHRTCSAAEQVINALNGIGVPVITIGDTSCGKPVGFLPQADGCGTTYNVVNFESVNERNEGRYFDGFGATCPVAEDFTQALGSPTEPLLDTARRFADSGACPSVAAGKAQPFSVRAKSLRAAPEPGEVRGMLAR